MTATASSQQPLALLGGPKTLTANDPTMFAWPIVTQEDEQAVLEVLRAGKMSGWDITQLFEKEWGAYLGTSHNLGFCNGTAALLGAMYGVGLGRGDEMIVPSLTYWASALQAFSLGATPVFADIDPITLCVDAKDIERKITPRTKAIMVVHYCGHPADMDAIMALARKHKIKVIEDGSHAHGTLYKGRLVGTFGDVAGFSMMAGKSFPIGEGGMLSCNDQEIYERAVAFAHYERTMSHLTLPPLKQWAAAPGFASGLPVGGMKGRLNQTCSAMGRVQLKYYPQRSAEIQKAMNHFWDLLEGVPGIRPHRPAAGSGSTMGGWYNPLGHYVPEELGGLSIDKFAQAVSAEGVPCRRGANFPLHLHPLLHDADIYNDGKPTRIAFSNRDVRIGQGKGSLPVSEQLSERCLSIPYFKHDRPQILEQYAAAYRKVALQADKLM